MTVPRVDQGDARHLRRWAGDTWRSMDAMTPAGTGLPSDSIDADLGVGAGYTSPTNIGGYLWSAVVARDLDLITAAECARRVARTVDSVAALERHPGSGMFFNWYDERTGTRLDAMPDGAVIEPFLSSVDNGWLAAGLMVVGRAVPEVADRVAAVLDPMRFDAFHDPDAVPGAPAGLMRGGFWLDTPARPAVVADYLGHGEHLFHTTHHYGPVMSETRIASYVGIARGQIPPAHWFVMGRGTAPDQAPGDRESSRVVEVGVTRQLGVEVRAAVYGYRGIHLVPTWGGSMFEALMPELLVPEATWSPADWGANHRLTVRAQREFGLDDAGFGSWGFSPASRPGGGYSEWGVGPIGMSPTGYPSDLERTDFRGGGPYGDGVVTPHALFLAAGHEPASAVSALLDLENRFSAYGPGGFHDAVAVRSGLTADRHLALDQSMILGAVGNLLCGSDLRRAFAGPEVTARLRPLLAADRFPVAPG